MTDTSHTTVDTALQGAEAMLFDSSLDGMLMVECLSGTIVRSNASVERLLGYASGEIVDRPYTILFPPESSGRALDASDKFQVHDMVIRREFSRFDGATVSLDLTAVMVSSHERDFILVTLRDTREREAHERRIVDAARVDALTGLYSRTELRRRLEQEHLRSLRYEIPYSICFVDIDSYNSVYDAHGNMVGDAVLKAFARALASELRANDFAGRYRGDVILVVLPHTDASTAFSVVERIRKRIAISPLRAGRAAVSVTASFGIACARTGIDDAEQALAYANLALYEAKQQGRNRTCIHEHVVTPQGGRSSDRSLPAERGHDY